MSLEGQGVSPERNTIETVSQAARAVHEIYGSLYDRAHRLTNNYLERRTLGEEGPTWHYVSRPDVGRKKVPHLGPVLSVHNKVVLDGKLSDQTGRLVSPYYLDPLKNPEDGIVICDTGWSSESGFSKIPRAYIAKPSGVIVEATAIPAENPDDTGNHPWGAVDLTQVFPVVGVSDELRTMIENIQSYVK